MDRLTDLSATLSNLTMYDIKSAYNQVSPYCSTTAATSQSLASEFFEIAEKGLIGQEYGAERERDGGEG